MFMWCCRENLDSANDDYLTVVNDGEQYENDAGVVATYVTTVIHFE